MRSVVVGVRGGTAPEPALQLALDEAARRRLPVEVVHAYDTPHYGSIPTALVPGALRAARATAERAVQEAVDRARAAGMIAPSVHVHAVVQEGDPASVLLLTADTAALLVVGTRGLGPVERALRGSVSARCLHRSQAPVIVVPESSGFPVDRWLGSKVVVGVDGSPDSLSALTWATAQAREWGATLVPVVALSHGAAPVALLGSSDVATALWRLVAEAGADDLEVQPQYPVGPIVEALTGAVGSDDLLVLGAGGHRAAALVGGSSSRRVAESAVCPVVVVRAGQARREIHQRRAHTTLAVPPPG